MYGTCYGLIAPRPGEVIGCREPPPPPSTPRILPLLPAPLKALCLYVNLPYIWYKIPHQSRRSIQRGQRLVNVSIPSPPLPSPLFSSSPLLFLPGVADSGRHHLHGVRIRVRWGRDRPDPRRGVFRRRQDVGAHGDGHAGEAAPYGEVLVLGVLGVQGGPAQVRTVAAAAATVAVCFSPLSRR